MAELSKYDLLISDLGGLETQASILKSKCKDLLERNSELENLLKEYQKENSALHQKLKNLEIEFDNFKNDSEGQFINLLNTKERETLKAKIQNLISRIDYHISS
ncbi:MAG: hypothetical protein ABI550_07005 [Ignavibacteriaceae bacterium]